MERTSKIAILLATYNGEVYITEQLNSLIYQTFTNWIVYIHDDGSSDNTRMIIDEFIKKYPSKFVYIDGPSSGGAKNNFFYLLKMVDAPIYMFCDQDDFWVNTKIEKIVDYSLLYDMGPCLVYSDLSVTDKRLNIISKSFYDYYRFTEKDFTIERLLVRNTIPGCTICINKSLRNMMIKYNNIDNVPMHDKWAILLAKKFGSVKKIDEPLVYYRQHDNNTIGVKQNGINYFFDKIKNIKKIHENYKFTWKQAEEITKIFSLPDDDIFAIYASCNKCNKLKRIYIYFKYGFKTNSLTQVLGLLIGG